MRMEAPFLLSQSSSEQIHQPKQADWPAALVGDNQAGYLTLAHNPQAIDGGVCGIDTRGGNDGVGG